MLNFDLCFDTLFSQGTATSLKQFAFCALIKACATCFQDRLEWSDNDGRTKDCMPLFVAKRKQGVDRRELDRNLLIKRVKKLLELQMNESKRVRDVSSHFVSDIFKNKGAKEIVPWQKDQSVTHCPHCHVFRSCIHVCRLRSTGSTDAITVDCAVILFAPLFCAVKSCC